MFKGCGTINFWGSTPPISVFKEHKDSCVLTHSSNILLIGSGDIRHILQILSEIKNVSLESPINVYVLESRVEVYARQLLQLYIATREQPDSSMQEKVEHFLEIFGNLRVRSSTNEYIQQCATELVRIITDDGLRLRSLPFVNLTDMKYKEMDFLESIFKFWKGDTMSSSNMDAKIFWDLRLRQFLGSKYDYRKGAFDWDYNMRLCERNAQINKVISPGDYCNWRASGNAFELREADYSETNKTLISCSSLTNRSGEKVLRYGYWGDTVNSPYISFNLEPECENFQEKNSPKLNAGERPYNASVAVGVAEKHVTSYLESLLSVNSSVVENVAKKLKIHFLPSSGLIDLPRKVKFNKKFDFCYVSTSLFHDLSSHFLAATLKENSQIVLETCKNFVEISHDQASKLEDMLTERIISFGAKPSDVNNLKKSSYKSFLYFTYNKPLEEEIVCDSNLTNETVNSILHQFDDQNNKKK